MLIHGFDVLLYNTLPASTGNVGGVRVSYVYVRGIRPALGQYRVSVLDAGSIFTQCWIDQTTLIVGLLVIFGQYSATTPHTRGTWCVKRDAYCNDPHARQM